LPPFSEKLRQPALHGSFVSEITFAKSLLQARLLDKKDKEVKQSKYRQSKKQDRK
jgi:hypothetical protein